MTGSEDGEPESSPASTDGKRSGRVAMACLGLLAASLGYIIYGPPFFATEVAGIAVLFAIPCSIGGLVAAMLDPTGGRSPVGCLAIPTLILLGLTLVGWLLFREGVICIAMVLPIWIPAALGGALAHAWISRRAPWDRRWRLRTSAWIALPAFAFATDALAPPAWQHVDVEREVTVAASRNAVWPLLVSIPGIRPEEGRWNPTQDLLGIPRPIDAKLVRREDGLVREARWGDGIRFEERITQLEPGRRIAWRFAFPDDSVQLRTDQHISPDGPILKIESGRYDLETLADGRTRVRLTTRYAMRSRLSGYLAIWAERFLGDIESNVLEIVRTRAQRRENALAVR